MTEHKGPVPRKQAKCTEANECQQSVHRKRGRRGMTASNIPAAQKRANRSRFKSGIMTKSKRPRNDNRDPP